MNLPKGTHGVFTGQPTAAPWSIPTDDLIVKRKEWERLGADLERLCKENERLNRAIVAHHEMSTLSDEAIAEAYGPGGTGACPICRRAVPGETEAE